MHDANVICYWKKTTWKMSWYVNWMVRIGIRYTHLKVDVVYCHSPAGAIRSVIAVMMICSLSPLSFMPSSLQQDPENRSSESTGNFMRFQVAIKVLTYISFYIFMLMFMIREYWIIDWWQLVIKQSPPGSWISTCQDQGQSTLVSQGRWHQMTEKCKWMPEHPGPYSNARVHFIT